MSEPLNAEKQTTLDKLKVNDTFKLINSDWLTIRKIYTGLIVCSGNINDPDTYTFFQIRGAKHCTVWLK